MKANGSVIDIKFAAYAPVFDVFISLYYYHTNAEHIKYLSTNGFVRTEHFLFNLQEASQI